MSATAYILMRWCVSDEAADSVRSHGAHEIKIFVEYSAALVALMVGW